VPGVLFLPDLFYDHRIWAGLPSSLGADCDAVCYDEHEPMPCGNLTAGAFLDAVRRLVPDPGGSVVAAAGQAAGLAVQAALCGAWPVGGPHRRSGGDRRRTTHRTGDGNLARCLCRTAHGIRCRAWLSGDSRARSPSAGRSDGRRSRSAAPAGRAALGGPAG
jgi:hypothetical protein